MAFSGKTSLPFYKALLLAVAVTNTFNNSLGQAFENRVLPNLQGKKCWHFPFSLGTTLGIYSTNIYLLGAYCRPGATPSAKVTKILV